MSNKPNHKKSRTSSQVRNQQANDQNRTVLFIGGGVALVVVLALVVAMVLTSDSTDTFETQAVTIGGEPLPDYAGDPDPAVGQPAPTLVGTSIDDLPLAIENDGSPKVIMFLAHWCPHCQQEVKDLQAAFAEEGYPEGADIYGVLTLSDRTKGNWPPDQWLEDEHWEIPTLVDDADDSASVAFGVKGTPFWVAVAADGTVVQRASGSLGPDALAAMVAAAAAGGSDTGAATGPAVTVP